MTDNNPKEGGDTKADGQKKEVRMSPQDQTDVSFPQSNCFRLTTSNSTTLWPMVLFRTESARTFYSAYSFSHLLSEWSQCSHFPSFKDNPL